MAANTRIMGVFANLLTDNVIYGFVKNPDFYCLQRAAYWAAFSVPLHCNGYSVGRWYAAKRLPTSALLRNEMLKMICRQVRDVILSLFKWFLPSWFAKKYKRFFVILLLQKSVFYCAFAYSFPSQSGVCFCQCVCSDCRAFFLCCHLAGRAFYPVSFFVAGIIYYWYPYQQLWIFILLYSI